MTYWIYNMGMPIRVDSNRLLDKRKVEPLAALTRNRALQGSDKQDNRSASIVGPAIAYDQEAQRQKIEFASQIMTAGIKSLPPEMLFDDAWQQFLKYKYRHFPIIDKSERLLGIISDRDMLGYAASGKSHKITINKLMISPVLTASPKSPIREICEIMFIQHIGALPITNDAGQILGIVTRSDILRSMIKHGPMELWA